MHARKLMLGVAILAAALVSAGCVPVPTPQPVYTACVDFEPPLVIGTQYGQPASQSPGDLTFTGGSISVAVWDFVFTNGGGTFNMARIEAARPVFGQGQIVNTNNINLEFDFTALGFSPQEVTAEFLDMGGFKNVSVNGSPVFAGELAAAPAPAGFTVNVIAAPTPGGKKGMVTIGGPVKTLRIGGQEFWLEQCLRKGLIRNRTLTLRISASSGFRTIAA